ncbi:hypothetical protein [Emcibacter sp. SYSU 3D8]|uniref:hypothetical protein n=1 Tax=Emcibacter sp. SYSU 3D8 TaxID=3133969 RepID=UPI0031FF4338
MARSRDLPWNRQDLVNVKATPRQFSAEPWSRLVVRPWRPENANQGLDGYMIKVGALAALTFVALSAWPSTAQVAWRDIGSVDFDRGGDHERQYGNFGGPIEKLRLAASGNDVICKSVTATFNNGKTRQIFEGRIRKGAATAVDLPGKERQIRKLGFRCRSEGRRDARINIAADLGSFSDIWQRNPAWASLFGVAVTADRGHDRQDGRSDGRHNYRDEDRMNGWVRLGADSFEGRRDREAVSAGWKGRSVDTLGLRAVNGDARCSRVYVTFGNGKTQDLDIGDRGRLREGDFHRIDLPGDERNVRQLQLVCSSIGDRQVTIESYAHEGRRNYRDEDRMNGWVRLGADSFEGRRDREAVSTGWKGRSVDTLGLRAVNGDARCSRVYVTFGNGKTRDLDIGDRGRLREGDFHRIDLPGDERNVSQLQLVCSSIGDRQVTIESYAHK